MEPQTILQQLNPYTLVVSSLKGQRARYRFDQPQLIVGRGVEADLRVEHSAFSRSQFSVERSMGSQGEARFRIIPFEATNPTYVNGRPAVEGTLMPGDIIAVADLRLMLEYRPIKGIMGGKSLPPARAALLGLVVVMLAVVGYQFLDTTQSGGKELTSSEVKLFGPPPSVSCQTEVECEQKARDAHERWKHEMTQTTADPGAYYRGTLELQRADRYREQSHRVIPEFANLENDLAATRGKAESEFYDAKFRLSRAIVAGDMKRQLKEAAFLSRLIPDDHHPYRVRLDAYRRTLADKGEAK